MRYMILQPRHGGTLDPRGLKIDSIAQLHDQLPPVAECASEEEAIKVLRKAMPNAVGMPCDLKIGAGTTLLLCFVEDANTPVDPSGECDFVAFVQPVSEGEVDRKAIKRATEGQVGLVFDALAWAPKPIRPELGCNVPVEVRTSELALPAFTDARVGYAHGNLVVFLEVGGITCSIEFRAPIGWAIGHGGSGGGTSE